MILCFRTEKTSLELRVSHPYIKSVFSGKNFLSSQFFLLMFCFYFLCLIMIDKKMVKGLAIMSLVMLQANIFVPTGISLAEEGESVASTVQGESLAIESSSLQEDLAFASAEESVTGMAAQVFEEVVQATGEVVDASGVVMPSLDMLMSATGAHMSGELSASIISDLGVFAESTPSTVVCDDTHVAKAVVEEKEVCFTALPAALMQADLDTTVVLLKDVSYEKLNVH